MISASQNYTINQYGQPNKMTIWFANPYIPWHDPEVPGGKLGEELTITASGECTISSLVVNSEKRKTILGKPAEKATISAQAAQDYLIQALSVLNYLGKKKTNKHQIALKETTIWTDQGQFTFTNYQDNEHLALYKLSMAIRNSLNRADLMVFDGNSHEDFVDKMEIKYAENDGYQEKITLNRQKDTLTYLRKFSPEVKVSTTYTLKNDISKFLDNLNPIDFTNTIPGLPENALPDNGKLGHFQCKIIRRQLEPIKISGDYERYCLPENWSSLMDFLSEVTNVSSTGKLLDRDYYTRTRRCKDDLIYLTVSFAPDSKKYNYLTGDDSIEIGDWVEVPVGRDNRKQQVLVVGKNYYNKDDVPYPLNKIKRVIRKIVDDE